MGVFIGLYCYIHLYLYMAAFGNLLLLGLLLTAMALAKAPEIKIK